MFTMAQMSIVGISHMCAFCEGPSCIGTRTLRMGVEVALVEEFFPVLHAFATRGKGAEARVKVFGE